ncbi:MAG: hypothetical protein MN733_21310 [Nitrososphaera sp.]|nr:hypothetical protein [Nitrososphaera sp.]
MVKKPVTHILDTPIALARRRRPDSRDPCGFEAGNLRRKRVIPKAVLARGIDRQIPIERLHHNIVLSLKMYCEQHWGEEHQQPAKQLV